VLLTAATLVLLGLVIAAIWMRVGVAVRRRIYESLAAGATTAAAITAFTVVTASHDWSENRMNSFSRSDERILASIGEPLRIEAHLAAQDSRRVDLERRAIAKLRRVMRRLDVEYVANTSTGMFEQTGEQYGEIWYELGGRRAMSRTTTAEGVLETIYSLAGVAPPRESADDVFRGHPLAVPPRRAAGIFYVVWPTLVVAAAIFIQRRHS
jgi:hypothetical protein